LTLACGAASAAVASANPTALAPGYGYFFGRPALPYRHTPPRPPAPRVRITNADRINAMAAGWQPVTAPAPFGANGAGTALLMTDGTVMIGDNESAWYSLAPDNTGNYVNGTWTAKASLPGHYGPLYFASAVLADGKLIVNGGEYNFYEEVETNQGAIYDPLTNVWTAVAPPTGWANVGDAQSVVLSNGTYTIGNCCTNLQAEYDESTSTWTQVGKGKADDNSEEGWTLLPAGTVLDTNVFDAPNSELFNPAKAVWSTAGHTPVNLTAAYEIGPQVLRPDGSVLVVGATGATAIYQSATDKWTAGPSLPVIGGKQVDIADGPATLLTNGDVLMAASAGIYQSPSYFFIFNGKTLARIPGPPNAPNNSSYQYRLLMLPTGQVLETDGSDDVEIYTPKVHPDVSYAPVIGSVPKTLVHAKTYKISGKYFNGVSQVNAYGDDAQAATNYPLVAITNAATGHVFFARTHDHSSMAVASTATVSTNFDVPATIETGPSYLVVVTNGIQSARASVTIK
jgi:hypothetical protein